jgi:hypothetical protein
MGSALNPGQPFCAVKVIAKWVPRPAFLTTLIEVTLEVTATQGIVPPELLNVPGLAVTASGVPEPFDIVTHTLRAILEGLQLASVWNPTGIPAAGAVPVIL